MVTRFACAACERLAPYCAFQHSGADLHLTCARCGADNVLERSAPRAEAGAEPQQAAPAASAAAAGPRIVSLRPVDDAVGLARQAALAQDPFAIPEDRCPKCIGPRDAQALSCPGCGLVYVNHRAEFVAPSAELGQIMREALLRWDDDVAHRALLEWASARGELPQLGRFYRLRLAAAPHDPLAQRGRDEVLERAAAASPLRPSDPAERPTFALPYLALVAALGVLAVALWLVLGAGPAR
jgi:hypothetical protein